MIDVIKGWHFTDDRLRDGRPIPAIGEWLEHTGDIVPCKSGLHASEHQFDALEYAPGALLHKVELEGDLQLHDNPIDKWVGRRRRILASRDATYMLWHFARLCALDVIHLCDAPDVVRQYLETGDESLRIAAQDAAGIVAWDAAGAAALAAARIAAWDAAGSAERIAAWDAAQAAAQASARAAIWTAAQDAARDAQHIRFASMVDELFNEPSEPMEPLKEVNDEN